MKSGLSILIADDREPIREGLGDKAKGYGASVIILASSGNEALEIIKSDIRLDVVISDNSMPPGSVSGVELLQETRKLPHRQELLFTLYTADLWGRQREEAELLGAVVMKPSRMEELFTMAFSRRALGSQLVRT
jgi:CheY-like chemotaxis protein